MHPPTCKHVHSLRSRLLLLCIGLLGFAVWTGCTNDSPPPERFLASTDTLFEATGEERQAALDALQDVERTALDTAFQRLERHAFTRYNRTEQFTPRNEMNAYVERTTRHGNDTSPEVLHADSAGTFQTGFLDRFFATDDVDLLPAELVDYAVPDEPAYLSEREQEAFRYRLRSDTLASGHPVDVVDVAAQPGEVGADQSIRYARVYVDPESREMVGFYIVHSDDGWLFNEDSRFFVTLRPVDGTWLPHVTRFRAQVGVPLRAPVTFGASAAYYAYN